MDDFARRRKIEFLFQVKVPSRTFNLIAPDFDTRQSWVDALLARIPNQNVPLKTKFSAGMAADLFSDESEPEDAGLHEDSSPGAVTASGVPSREGEALASLVEKSCLKCRETVKELVGANPFNVSVTFSPPFPLHTRADLTSLSSAGRGKSKIHPQRQPGVLERVPADCGVRGSRHAL